MPAFGSRSLKQLSTCHPDLVKLANEAIKHIDFAVLEGHRTEARQQQAFSTGHSKVSWPNSKHNLVPSRAFDFAPYPVNWKNHKEFYRVIGVLQACARMLGIKVRFGADFKSIADLGHVELE